MLKKVGSWLSSFLILCIATTSLAQVTRHAFEAVATEELSVELQDGERVQGQLRYVDDERAVILSDAGDVRDIELKDVSRLRLASSDPKRAPSKAEAGGDATERAQKHVEESLSAAEDADESFHQRGSTTGYLDERSSGYLSSNDPSTHNPFARPTSAQGLLPDSQPWMLSTIDYEQYRSMLRGSRVKRVIGWSLFATGAVFLTGAIQAANRARRYNDEFKYPGMFVFGAVSALTGLPIAVAGRQQYRRAGEFAREAAEGRAAIEANRQEGARTSAEGARAAED